MNARFGRLIVVAYVFPAVLVFSMWALDTEGDTAINQYPDRALARLVHGTASRPFVLRPLVPWCVRTIEMLLPDSVEHALSSELFDDRMGPQLRAKLLAVRERRIRPGLDDKVLADWNGLMIAALVNSALIIDEPDWLTMAQRAFDFVARSMTKGDRLGHSWREAQLLFPGLASDFAAMIRAALSLYEATGERRYLEKALAWHNSFDKHYIDAETGAYYLSSDDADDLVLRPHSTQDDATPNPNSVAAQNLVRLAVLSGDDKWRKQGDRLIETILSGAERNLFGHIALLNALDLRLRAAEIVVTGPDAGRFAKAALSLPYLDRIVLRKLAGR